MSEIAGRIATQAGAFFLEKPMGGRGILLGGVLGVAAANVMVIGAGAVGTAFAHIAVGMSPTCSLSSASTRSAAPTCSSPACCRPCSA